jgi:hypothetical protein
MEEEMVNDVAGDRVEMFKAFRASLSAEEQKGLDAKILRWRKLMVGTQFGELGAEELFVALIEFEEKIL